MRSAVTLLSLALLVGCGSQQPGTQVPERSATAVKVQIASAKKEHHSQTQRLPGTVRAIRSAALASKLMGTILQVKVHAGDRVKAGQLLVVIDSREAEAMIQKAEAGRREAEMALQETESHIVASQANLTLSEATLKRYEALRVEKSATPQEFEEVQARQRAAAASLEALQARKQQVLAKAKQTEADHRNAEALHSYAELRAPFDGVITQKHADPGSLAVPGVPVLTIEESSRYRLEVPVEESRVSAIKPGQKLEVRIAAAGDEPIQGVVREIEPSADPVSRTYLVKVELPLRSLLRSGMYGEVLLPGGPSDAIWIESRSIVRQGQIEGVYVVEGGNVARLRLLKLGSVGGNQVEVLSGLTHSESYVSVPVPGLKDGARVEVVP